MKHAEIEANARKPYAEAIQRVTAERDELLALVERAAGLMEMNGTARQCLVEDCNAAIAKAKQATK